MKAIVLTSTFRRHMFVANTLAQSCDVIGVWQEAKSFHPERYANNDAEEKVIQDHFAKRDASEERYFTQHTSVSVSRGTLHRQVPAAACNDPEEIARMAALKPDIVFVFGTGILRQPMLSAFDHRILNIHLGLSPYYRGAGTNFWPLVNREPEYVGATIHYLDSEIDRGAILSHARPLIELGDGPHDVGNKTIVAAVATALRAAGAHLSGTARAVPQWHTGRLYQRKHFSAEAVRRLYRNFETGMIEQYLAARASRDAALRLIELERVV